MKILVCIKQVPGTNKVEVDEKTGVLKRNSADAKMNPFDLFAIEQALKIREQCGGSVEVLSMGPAQAEEVLKEAIWMGADRGTLLCDRRFAGADVAATSYTISQGIRKIGTFDLIICGKQTTDGDTAQVGPELAELLGMNHVCNVQDIVETGEKSITVLENQETCLRELEIPFPCLITVEKDANTPRLPSIKRAMEKKSGEITWLGMDDLFDTDAGHYGLEGSPTQVERIFPPTTNNDRIIFEGSSEEICVRMYEILSEEKFV